MVERGGGTIINVTTMAAELGMAGLSAYGASKAAVALLNKAWAWAAEYGPKGVASECVEQLVGARRGPRFGSMVLETQDLCWSNHSSIGSGRRWNSM
jgi:hypothetical protein